MKKETIVVKLGRKKVAPPNLAARALREGQFQPKVEKGPKANARPRKRPIPKGIEDDEELDN